MRKILLLSLVSLAGSGQVRTSQDKDFDLIHSELHLKPIWTNQTLEGRAILTLKPFFYKQNKLVLNAKDFDITSIRLDKSELKYTYDGRLITIALGKTFTAKDSFKLAIEYIAQPGKVRIIDKEENKSEKGLYFINPLGEIKGLPTQLWTQGETQSNSSWFPTLDFPNQNHTQDIFITIDKKYTTLSNGILKSSKDADSGLRTDHWSQALPHAVYLTMLAAGDFVKVVDTDFKRFEISYYMEPEYAPYAHGIFGRTREMINYFESLLGVKYPWAKYAQVPIRKFISGAMENTTATTHNRSVLKNNHQLVDGNDDAVIAHELFHHWFGDYVTCESWAQLPLNEAFANYSEYLWAAHKYGKDEGDYAYMTDLQSYIGESQEKKVPLIRFNYLSSEDMFDTHSYQKGGRVLHTLRNEVGDEAFFKALKVYLNENAFQTVEVEDLRIVFEKVTGKDLKWFFDQWFMRSGHPVLDIRRDLEGNKLKLTVNQELDSTSTHLFRLKLPLRLITAQSVKDTVLQIVDSTTAFEFELDGEFKNYIPNASGYFLGIVKDDRSEEEYIHQFDHSPEIFSRIMGMETALSMGDAEHPLQEEKYRNLVLQAMNDKFWRIRQMAVQQFMDYDGANFFEVEKALEEKIKNDESSNVRADALLSVKTFQNPYHLELALKSMTDTSYAVRAAALEILLVNQVPQSDSLVAIYQDVNDSNIFATVANYFVAKNEPGKTDWMINRMKLMEGMDLYQFLGLLGSYLIVSEDNQLEKALPFLRETAINEGTWYSRLSGVRVLYAVKDLSEQANAVFREALKAETDERLINYYKQFDVER